MEPVGFRDVALGDRQKAGQPRFGGQQVVVRRITTTRPLLVCETIANREELPLRVVKESEVHAIEQGDGSTGQMVETFRPRCGGAVGRAASRQPLQRRRQRHECAGEVSAVDGRDIGGRKRCQSEGVVPVQQVTLEAFQALDGRERGVGPVSQFIGADETKVVGRERREQRHPDVRRRRAVRDGQCRDELDVVGRQRVILGSDERLEVPPRLLRHRLEKLAVLRAEHRAAGRHGAAERVRNQGRRRPQREDWYRRWQCVRTHQDDKGQAAERDERARDHVLHEHAQARRPATIGAGRGRLPLEQSVLRDPETHERHGDRVQHLVCLIREERQLQPDAYGVRLEIFNGGSQEGTS